MSLHILDAGLSCTVQDPGRRGYRRHGLASGGAADLHAFRWANKLLDNNPGAACLEIVMGGFRAVARHHITVAVTGADASLKVNGRPLAGWSTIKLKPDDELEIGMSRAGRLIYLALPGGVDGPELFGSQSMVAREQFSDHAGLEAGAEVACLSEEPAIPRRAVPDSHRRHYREDVCELDLLPGYQYREFDRYDLLRLTHSNYRVTQHSDRMGYRLSGPALEKADWQILSEGMVVGAVQIPGDGQPIVLMPDCQTIGGYPKPGALSRQDLGRLAQRLPGDSIRFRFTSPEDMQRKHLLSELFFRHTRWEANGCDLRWR
ncbi:biotin-dependent carboxyltransferase family protein [Marinobacter sp.]|uniref:5-oxoprolinase subunit C family protein n=1 Tax=Marinobacter sp. TaxID=50741 RepID=UPI001988B874|nr:biotin-dependent carboxyltransferase family protein [Marinobacter sp.]MBC7190930.1 biotin-dependent carboxyltransferase family protein [Marinobacter sp.]